MNDYLYEIKNLKLDNESLMLNETVFNNANGYIGVRSNFEEGYPEEFDSIRGSYINGFYDFTEMKQAENLYGFVNEKQTMLNVADTQEIRLWLGDEEFSMFEGTVLNSRRCLDMKEGVSVRQITWKSPKGHTVKLEIKRMTSFELLSLFTICYSITSVDYEGPVKIVSVHKADVKNYCNPKDPRVAGETSNYLIPYKSEIIDDVSYLTAKTSASNLMITTAVYNAISEKDKDELVLDGSRAIQSFFCQCTKGKKITLTKYTVFSDSIRTENTSKKAKDDMHTALQHPLLYWYQKQKEYLHCFWEQSALEIDTDEELSSAIRYNLYQLIQAVGKDEHSNIAAKGLSGEGYEGHYFWDTEMYMQPFFTMTNPEIAKNLIAYRYSTLEQARENARILGHKRGVLYPFQKLHYIQLS